MAAADSTSSTSVVTVKANSGLIYKYDCDTQSTGNVIVQLPEQSALQEGVSYDSVQFNKYGIAIGGTQGGSSVAFYQADWSVADATSRNFIKNKPTIPEVVAQSKSKAVTIQTPAVNDEAVLLYCVAAAAIATINIACVGTTSATVRVYHSSTLGAGTSGTPVCAATTVTPSDNAKSVAVTAANIAAGEFVYVVVTALAGTPALVNINISYTGGE